MSKSYEKQKHDLVKVRDSYQKNLSQELENIQSLLGGKGKLVLLGLGGAVLLYVFGKGVQSIFGGTKSEKSHKSEKPNSKLSLMDKAREQLGLVLLAASKRMLVDFIERINEGTEKKPEK